MKRNALKRREGVAEPISGSDADMNAFAQEDIQNCSQNLGIPLKEVIMHNQ